MKKTISVIAASLLTATVVFTGCGGGGSTTSISSSSISSSSSVISSSSSSSTGTTCLPGQACDSSSSATPTPYQVTVADGYILNATVTSGDQTAIAIAPGKYEFADKTKVTNVIVSVGGINDLNENNQADAGEPTAPTMKAPAGYANVNAFTTLMLVGNLTEQEIINYYNTVYGLNLTTLDFDPVQADVNTKAEAVALTYILKVAENNGEIRATDALPDLSGSTTSTTSSAESSSTTVSVIESLINAVKNALPLENALPATEAAIIADIKKGMKEGNIDQVTCDFAQNKVCDTTNSSTNSVVCEELPGGGSTCDSSSSEVSSSTTSSSETSSSSENNTGSVGALPSL